MARFGGSVFHFFSNQWEWLEAIKDTVSIVRDKITDGWKWLVSSFRNQKSQKFKGALVAVRHKISAPGTFWARNPKNKGALVATSLLELS